MSKLLTAERLREVVSYDPLTGLFRWKVDRFAGKGARIAKAGQLAGHDDGRRYQKIGIDGAVYSAHRLAWLYAFGKWPVGFVDHANGNPSDNRLCNLRIASRSQNSANSRPPRRFGKGAYFRRDSGKYEAQIRVSRKCIHLGTFTTFSEAHAAYVKAAAEYFGEFARAA